MYGFVKPGIIFVSTLVSINLTIYGLTKLSESDITIQFDKYRTAMRQYKQGHLDKKPRFADFRFKKNSIPTPEAD